MKHVVAEWIVKLLMIPFVFIVGGYHAVGAFLSNPKRDRIVKENDIP